MRYPIIVNIVRPYKAQLLGALAAALCESAVTLLGPWPLKIVFDSVLGQHPLPGWLQPWSGTDKLAVLQFAAVAALAIAAAGAVCTYAEKHFTTTVGQWISHDLRKTLYFHVQRLGLSYHDRKQTGDLISRITSDIDSMQSFITSGMLTAIIQTATLGGMVAVMFYINWQFTLIALSVAPLLFFVVFRYTRMIKQFSRDMRKQEGRVVSMVEEVLTSIRVVKAFAREEYEQKRLEEQSLETVEAALKARSVKAKLTPLVEIIVAAGTSLVIWYGGRMALEGNLSPGSLIVFVSYLAKMYKPMQELSKMTDTYSKAVVGYERVVEVLETENDIKDPPRAKNAPKFRGAIEFDSVSFAYVKDQPVLSNLSFRVEPGQVAAIVGPTGAGKSTILGMLSRFYDPQSGAVRIDGQDIRTFKQKSVREQISIVLQETLLFAGPIWENIAYGRPGAKREEILRAAETANVDEFVNKLPEGYDTVVGERGVTLSGGQRQRVAIARAVIRNTPILLLDEPSSGLDAASEKLVFEALDRLMEGKTALVVAHRLSTIRRADAIFVLRDGRIVETGTHDELIAAGGFYAELYEIQFGGVEAEHR
ncbi:MAG: ABC transporter ATP-binding protein [Acidobacteria bacterium]|nr:ABC transporter ATP-binding protein [Acidobacteriota bacterium]